MTPKDNAGNETVTINVPDDCDRERLDKFLGNLGDLKLSRTKVVKLLAEGLILVDGRAVASKFALTGGETIEITVPPMTVTEIVGEDIPIDIIYEDEHLAVVNKQAGLVTHPAVGNRSGTLVNALVHHFGQLSEQAGSDRPGIVHRLDKNTSGLLVIARDDETYVALQNAIQSRELKRTYHALICGHVQQEHGLIDLPIGRSTRNRTRMAITSVKGRDSVTEYQLLSRYRSYDLLEISLHTGRTHQIRVHFSHLGHPVFGDPDYGGREKWHKGMFAPERPLARKLFGVFDRQALHAKKLEFVHPATGETMTFESDLPEDFQNLLNLLDEEGA